MSKKKLNDKAKLVQKLGLTKQDLIDILYNITLSRRVDDAEIAMKKQGTAFFQISGAGHEGILTSLSRVLKPSYDYVIPYYRDRALCLGLGMTPYEMLCQANGNTGDIASHGRQMPAHWGHKELNIISKSSCTGTQFLQAVGVAEGGRFIEQLKKLKRSESESLPSHSDEIVLASCGDGTTSQGEFWEAITTASVNKLPVLFLVEDNGYAISVPVSVQTPKGSISKALDEFPGLKIIEVDGTCPIEGLKASLKAEEHLRAGKGPVLLHAHVTRPYSHSLSDSHDMYRSQKELIEEKEKDVLTAFPKFLKESKLLSEQEVDGIMAQAKADVAEAKVKAVDTPWPSKDTATDHVFSEDVDLTSSEFDQEGIFEGKDDIPMASAINSVLKSEVKRNSLIRVFGEDVADFSELEKLETDLKGKGGVFKVTHGVQRAGVEGQVFNSPLAEANIIGRAIGMALRGLRPVVEIQFFDYIWTAYMQLKNEMATTRYRSGGDYKCPMVVRVPIGGYLKGGSIYHSQCGESLFTHIPGICVVFPSNAKDAAGLLRTAIRGDDPVMFLEHKHLYYQGHNRTADPGPDFMIPFGKGRVVKEGKDLTILTWGALVHRSLEASRKLESEGISVEIIDPRTLVPFDMEIIKKSLSKTNRLLIIHEETKTSGFAGEVAMRVNEECFEELDAPIRRLTTPDSHIAYCPDLEEVLLPQTDDVYQACRSILDY